MWKVEDYNLELGDWRAARRLVFWVSCVLLSCDTHTALKNCWYKIWKEVAVSAFGYLHHQPEKFQNWHLLSFSASWEFLLLSLGTARRVLCFFFFLSKKVRVMFLLGWMQEQTQCHQQVVYHLPHLGPEINTALAGPETQVLIAKCI